jgi:hypothetical protein
MAKTSATPSPEILEAALRGLEAQKQQLDEHIAELRSMMGRRVGRPPRGNSGAASQSKGSEGKGRKKRSLSPEARKRIAAAQKKRWANFRKGRGE